MALDLNSGDSIESAERSHWPIAFCTGLSALVNLLLPLVLVRILTPEEVGTFKLFFLYLMLVPDLSLCDGVVNGIAYWAGRDERGAGAIRASSLLILGLAILFFGVVVLLQPTLVEFLGWDSEYVFIFAVAAFALVTSTFFEEAAMATGRIWLGSIFHAGFAVVRTLVVLTAALIYQTVIAVFIAHAAVLLCKALISYVAAFKHGMCGFALEKSVFRDVLKYAVPVAIAGVMSVFVGYADQFVLSTHLTTSDFAIYAIGCLALPPLFIFEHSVTRVLIPQMSEAFEQSAFFSAKRCYYRAVEQLGLLIVPCVFGLMVFAHPLITLLFTENYSAAAPYLEIFALSYLFLVVPYDVIPRARGEGRWILTNYAVFSALALGLCYFLAGHYGAFGALSGMLMANAAMRVYGIFYVARSTGWQVRQFLPVDSLLRFALICTIASLVVLQLKPLFESELMWLIVCGPLYGALYLSVLSLWKVRNRNSETGVANVLMLTQHLHVGGLERMVMDLSRGLEARTEPKRWQVRVFAYDQAEDAQAEDGISDMVATFRRNGIAVETYEKGEGFSLRVVLKIIQFFLRNDIAVIHSHDLGGLIYGAIAKIFSFVNVKLVHTQHSFVYVSDNKRYCFYQRIFSYFADELVVVSEGTRDICRELKIGTSKIHVVENGVALSGRRALEESDLHSARSTLLENIPFASSRQALASSIDDRWIVYLARLRRGKGQEHAISIWNALEESVRQAAVLIFVGPEDAPGERARLQRLLEGVPNRERVIFAGGTDTPQQWLAASDCYLSCSEFEGHPIGPLEAIGEGVPTLLSDIPAHGFLSDVSQQYSLKTPRDGAEKLASMLQRVERGRRLLGQELEEYARWVRQHYSLDGMCGKYASIYLGEHK